MSAKAQAVVESLDCRVHAAISQFDLPTFDGRLGWALRQVKRSTRLTKTDIVFVVSADTRASAVADRVSQYRKAGRFALGACANTSMSLSRPMASVAQLKPSQWRISLRMLLTSVTAMIGEGQPEAFVCIDWRDVVGALKAPGELIFEWSVRNNADAFNSVFRRVKSRLSGRQCRSMLCLLSGGRHPWFAELRAALKTCRNVLTVGGVLVGGDRIVPFGGNPGCCLIVVADQ